MGFNRPITLPAGLRELEFVSEGNSRFNHPLILPSSLRKLCLGSDFNHQIVFPEGLEYVNFGYLFSQQLTLPSTLKVLDLQVSDFNHPLQLMMLEHLEELYLGDGYNQPIILPNSLLKAAFGDSFRGTGLRSLEWRCNHPICLLPTTLKDLYLGVEFQQPLHLEEGLEEITFEGSYNLPLVLPLSLKRIKFFEVYTLPLTLPPGCTRLGLLLPERKFWGIEAST